MNGLNQYKYKSLIRKIIISVISILAVMAVIIGVIFIPNNGSYTLVGEDNITLNVSDDIDLADYKISYKLIGGMEREVALTQEMLSGYDKNKVGEQTITIKYKDKIFYIKVNFVGRALSAPVVVRDGNRLTWQAVENASYYEIYLLDSDGTRLNTPIASTKELSFNLDNTDIYGYNDIVVVACSDKEGYLTSPSSDKLTVDKLAKIDNIRYENGILSWNAIKGASTYNVTIGDDVHEKLLKNELVVELKEGQTDITIRAVSETGTIVDSVASTIMEKVGTTSITTAPHEITWTAVQNATGYKIYVGESVEDMKELATTTELSYNIDNLEKGTKYIVGVCAIGDGDKIISGDKKNVDVFILEDVAGIKYENNRLTWNSVKNAESYTVTVNGEATNITTNALDVTLAVGENKIAIEPKSTNIGYMSRDTKTQVYTFIGSITNIALDGSNLSWASTQNAHTYDIYLDDKKVATDLSDTSYAIAMTEGIHAVKIVAKGKDATYFSSSTSAKLLSATISAKSGALVYDNSVSTSYDLYNGDEKIATFNSEENIRLSDYMTSGVPYSLSIGVNGVLGRSNVVVMTKKAAPSIVVRNNALVTTGGSNVAYYLDGHAFDGNVATIINVGVHIIKAINVSDADNVVSSDAASITVTKLASPDIVVRNNSIVVEDSANLRYYLNELEVSNPLAGITAEGKYTITAERIANGRDNVLDSTKSVIEVTKLGVPIVSVSDGKIVNVDGVCVYANGNIVLDDGSSLEAGKYNLTAKKTSNIDNVIDSNLSSAIEVIKLATPVIKYGNVVEITNRAANIDIYVDDVIFKGDLATLSTGKHSIKAQNRASNENELDSNMSEVYSTYILNVSITINEAYGDPNAISVLIDSDITFTYDMTVEYYDGDTLITSTTKSNLHSKSHVFKLMRGGVLANKVVVKVTPIIDGTNTREIIGTYTKGKE